MHPILSMRQSLLVLLTTGNALASPASQPSQPPLPQTQQRTQIQPHLARDVPLPALELAAFHAPLSHPPLFGRASSPSSCPLGYTSCDIPGLCISWLSTCCGSGSGSGSSCLSGYDCTGSSGCCASGAACAVNSQPSGCAASDRVACGSLCVPRDTVCCDADGSYCYVGQTCNSHGGCDGTPTGLGAGPSVRVDVALHRAATAKTAAAAGEDGADEDDGVRVAVKANLALVGLIGVMMVVL